MPIINGIYRPIIVFPFGPITASLNAFERGCLIFGIALIETTGSAPAEIDLLDSNSANTNLIAPFSLDPGQSIRDVFPTEGLFCQLGPFFNVLSGSVRGSLWYIDATAYDIAQLPSVVG